MDSSLRGGGMTQDAALTRRATTEEAYWLLFNMRLHGAEDLLSRRDSHAVVCAIFSGSSTRLDTSMAPE